MAPCAFEAAKHTTAILFSSAWFTVGRPIILAAVAEKKVQLLTGGRGLRLNDELVKY